MEQNGLDFEEFNIDSLPGVGILAKVAHDFELEVNNVLVFCILKELLAQSSLLHVVKMEKDVLRVYVRKDEPVGLRFVEELESPSDLVLDEVLVLGNRLLLSHLLVNLLNFRFLVRNKCF